MKREKKKKIGLSSSNWRKLEYIRKNLASFRLCLCTHTINAKFFPLPIETCGREIILLHEERKNEKNLSFVLKILKLDIALRG